MTNLKPIARLANDAQFVTKPHRPTLSFRALRIEELTDGRLTAQVVKATGSSDVPHGWHRHQVEIQFFYVISGTITIGYEHGSRTFGPGDLVVHPSGTIHRVEAHTADLELLEVTSPAGYHTEPVR
jgi:mannose-6-phosphate isomerase-like protein (cupin superfamily)